MATTVDGGLRANCSVEVVVLVPVSGISLDKTNLVVNVGITQKLIASIEPLDATNKTVTWSSDDTAVAEINGDGLITGKSEGTATITVTSADGGFTDTCYVEVKPNSLIVYFEDFTTTTYKDEATNADWNMGSLPANPQEVITKIKNYGGPYNDILYSVIKDSDGNYVAAGCTSRAGYDATHFEYDFYIGKFDQSFNLLNSKTFGSAAYKTYWGNDRVFSIIQDDDGNYICVGSSDGDLTSFGGNGNYATAGATNDFVIFKLDPNLNLLQLTSTGGYGHDIYKAVVQDHNGNYIAVGTTSSDLSWMSGIGGTVGQGGTDFIIMKYDKNLQKIKVKNFGGQFGDYLEGITTDQYNNYVVVGNRNGSPVLMQLNANFNIIKDQFSSGSSFIREDSENYTTSGTNGGKQSINKLNSNLNYIKGNGVLMNTVDPGIGGYYIRNSFAKDIHGNYLVFGWSDSDLTSIGGSASNGMNDFVICKFNPNLDFIGVTNFGGSGEDFFESSVWDKDGNMVVVGLSSSDLTALGGTSNSGNADFVIAQVAHQYQTAYNIIQSSAIPLGEMLNCLSIKVEDILPVGTNYEFYISIDGSNWVAVDNSALDGNTVINLPIPSTTLYWKAILHGTANSAPIIKSIMVTKGKAINYVYNELGQLDYIVLSSGQIIDYQYDDNGNFTGRVVQN